VKLPYGEVAPLIAELRGQADAQLAPVADTPQEDRTNDTAPVDLGTVGE
jgi:hypothetical protein